MTLPRRPQPETLAQTALCAGAPMGASFGTRSLGLIGAVWLVALACTLSPLLLVEIPAMGDYLNHLARMHLLVTQGNPFYQVSWRPVSYLTMDIVVPPIARVLGVELATKAFLALSQLLILSGATMLEIVVKRRVQIA